MIFFFFLLINIIFSQIDRFPRYILFLNEILKIIPIENPAHNLIEQSKEQIKVSLNKINDSKSDSEMFKEIQTMNEQVVFSKEMLVEGEEPTTTLIKSERRLLNRFECSYNGSNCHLWIFSDSVCCFSKPEHQKKYHLLWQVLTMDSHLEKFTTENQITITTNKKINIYPYSTVVSHTIVCPNEYGTQFWSDTWMGIQNTLKKETHAYISHINMSNHLIQNILTVKIILFLFYIFF